MRIPSYYGYDKHGSELFDAITYLPEYFLTWTEEALLREHGSEIANSTRCSTLIELGSGSARKTRYLLEAMSGIADVEFVPIDVSREMLESTSEQLLSHIPNLSITALIATWESGLKWVRDNRRTEPCVITFIGSGLGNMTPEERGALLSEIRAACKPGDYFLATADLEKPAYIFEKAYNDPPGSELWGKFRINRLIRLNKMFDADFEVSRYYDHSHYNHLTKAIESRLYASEDQVITLPAMDLEIQIRRGESIVVDYSYKFHRPTFTDELERFGFAPVGEWVNGIMQYGIFLTQIA